MEESCGEDDDDVEWRDKESGVFVVTSSCKEKESWNPLWPSRLRPSDGSVTVSSLRRRENMRVNKRSSSGRMMGPQSITHKIKTQHIRPSVAKVPAAPAEILIPCLFFCISFYRWWTSIIFITRRTNCWARPVNNSWASRWRRSSKRFCRRSKATCEPF